MKSRAEWNVQLFRVESVHCFCAREPSPRTDVAAQTGTCSHAKNYDKRVVRIESSFARMLRGRPTSRRTQFVSGVIVVRQVNIVTTTSKIDRFRIQASTKK